MMEECVRARALFDFESSMPGELSFTADEILTVTSQDVGDGWWEARNSCSQVGLIPVSYVEVIASVPNVVQRNVPLPPAKIQVSSNTTHGVNGGETVDIGWTDEEWDEDDDDEPVKSPTIKNNNNSMTGSRSSNDVSVTRRPSSDKRYSSQSSIRHRFSRMGPEGFVFDVSAVAVPDTEKAIVIIDGACGPIWQSAGCAYTCTVASPTIEKKYHGMKTYTVYQLVPTFSNIRVSRRYKQFDWLYQRLSDKFTTVAIPPLPDKQVTGRFEDEFVNMRLKQLQMWIDRMCKHPVVSECDVFKHFLSCTDPKRWTAGKRKAEKDDFTGTRLFYTVQSHVKAVDSRAIEARVESFGRFVKDMDDSVKNLYVVGERSAKKHEDAFNKHYRKLGSSFEQLAKSFELDERPVANRLTQAVHNTGKTYDEIGHLFAVQPKNDINELLVKLHEYHGLLSTFPDILLNHRMALSRLQERENSGKLFDSDYDTARQRVDIIGHGALAEADHFHEHRVEDFRVYMRHFLMGQITFFKTITAKLEDNLRNYE